MPGNAGALRRIASAMERAKAARAPREGFFSVLDELIQDLPADREFSRTELLQRLKAGNKFSLDDMEWPLKQTEIDYALMPSLDAEPGRIFDKNSLLSSVRERRPDFMSSTVSSGDSTSPFSAYDIKGPVRLPGSYFESVTRSPAFGDHPTHFDGDALTFSRGSVHDLDPLYPHGEADLLRLIVEIQNDRANDARSVAHVRRGKETLRGWRTPEMSARLEELRGKLNAPDEFARSTLSPEEAQEFADLKYSVKDAPFKTPQDYGRLEIKNSILDAIKHRDNRVGISPESPVGVDAHGTTYKGVYPRELEKIAKQYGADFELSPLPIQGVARRTWGALQRHGGAEAADIADLFDPSIHNSPLEHYEALQDLTSELIEAGLQTGVSEDIIRAARASQGRYGINRLADTGYASQRLADQWMNSLISLENEISRRKVKSVEVPNLKFNEGFLERIKKYGLPLFGVAGAGVLAQPEDQRDNWVER